jgi:hypothetical protein
MSIKLVLLKSGEQLIADVTTAVDKSAATWYYQLDRPYVVSAFDEPSEILIDDESPSGTPIQFVRWMPLTNDDKILMNHDWVVTIVNPIDDIVESYLKNRRSENGTTGDRDSSSSSEEQ